MLERVGAAGLFALVVLVFLMKGLPPGTSPVAVDPLYADGRQVPFEQVYPEGFKPHNPYLSDTAMQFYPWLRFMQKAVGNGELPLWAPYSGGGLPFVANLQSALFYPLTWLSLLPESVLSISRGMLFSAIVKLWLAGFFGFLLLRRIGLDRVSSALGGLGMMLFGYQVVWLFYALSNVACLLPLCLYLTHLFSERASPGRFVLLSLALALQFLGGHAETSLTLGVAVTIWFLLVRKTGDSPLPPVRALLGFVAAGVLALMLCAYQLLPFVEYMLLSQGRQNRLFATPPTLDLLSPFSAEGAVLCGVALVALLISCRLLRRDLGGRSGLLLGLLSGALGAGALFALERLGLRPKPLLCLEPDLYGSAMGSGYRGPESYTDVNGGYVGLFALALALLYLLSGERRRLALACGLMMLVAWILPGRLEPFHSLLRVVPPFDLTAGTRMLPLYGVGASVLAACACHELRAGKVATFRRGATRLAGAACVLALCILVSNAFLEPAPQQQGPVAEADGLRLDSPAPGQRFSPRVDARGRGHLEIPCAVSLPPGVAKVHFRIGDGYAAMVAPDAEVFARGGQVEALWHATREEEGPYRLRVELEDRSGNVRAGPEAVFRIDRSPSFTTPGIARMLAVFLLLGCLLMMSTGHRWPLLLAPLAVLCELFLFGVGYNSFVPEEIVFPRTGVTDFLAAERERALAEGSGPFRVMGEDNILPANMNFAYGLEIPRSYDQLESRFFFRYMLLLTLGKTDFAHYNHETLDYGSPIFSLLNVRYVVTRERLDHIPGFRLVFEEGHGKVYENGNAWPRASVLPAAVNVDGMSLEEALAHDPRQTALLLRPPPPGPLGGQGDVRFLEYGLNRVDLRVTADGPAMLLLTDNYFPGWEATVDGEPVDIYQSQLTFRAVKVPGGVSRVEFRYRPWSFRAGVLLALAALLVCGSILVASRWRRGTGDEDDSAPGREGQQPL
ncbi:MAG: YfhO family protein [Planctomycetota bacterium]